MFAVHDAANLYTALDSENLHLFCFRIHVITPRLNDIDKFPVTHEKNSTFE